MFKSSLEKKLESEYINIFLSIGMSPSESKSTFKIALKSIKQEAIKEGATDLPENYGDILLEREKKDDKIRHMINKIRKEGVKNEDIIFWWNLNYLERGMINFVDNLFRMQSIMMDTQKGLNQDEAIAQVRKYFPIYGDPDDTTNTTGDDRPLPFELKDRINIYIEKRSKNDPTKYKEDINKSSSLNAIIRKEIENGYL